MNCEVCQSELDLLDAYFSCPNFDSGEWQFTCATCPDGEYNFSTKSFFESPRATVNWLAHLMEKRWFKADKFFHFMARLRNE